MPTLYVTEPGSRIEKDYHRLVVTSPEDEILFAVPVSRVSEVVLVGSVGLTTQAMRELLRYGTSLSLISASGELLGRLQPATGKNIALRRRQYLSAADPAFCLALTREIVRGKIKNERVFLRRLAREHGVDTTSHVTRLNDILDKIDLAQDIGALRGLEGLAARIYFQAFRGALPEGWQFLARSRRPPRGPVNALLSLGYTVLTNNLIAAVEIAGLDPYEGFFHVDQYGRAALALDLVEEFRSLIVDALVLAVIHRRILQMDDFEESDGVCRLTQAGLGKFFQQYTRKLHAAVSHPLAEKPVSYQKCFEIQARQVRKCIEGEQDRYIPFLAR